MVSVLSFVLLICVSPVAAQSVEEVLVLVSDDGRIIEGQMDWTERVLLAYGEAGAPEGVTDAVQRRLTGFRAAKAIASGSLQELVGAVQVDAETRVSDVMAADPAVRARLSGLLQGAHVAPRSYQDTGGRYRLAVQVELGREFAEAVLPEFPPKPSFAALLPLADATGGSEPTDSTAAPGDTLPGEPAGEPHLGAPFALPEPVYTGLIVDARGLDLQPSMAPRILTTEGAEVYGPAFVERAYAAYAGVVRYFHGIEQALASTRLGGRNPRLLIVEALDAGGSYPTDAIIRPEDGFRVAMADAESGFLGQCQVGFVVGPRPAAPDSTTADSTLADSVWLDVPAPDWLDPHIPEQ